MWTVGGKGGCRHHYGREILRYPSTGAGQFIPVHVQWRTTRQQGHGDQRTPPKDRTRNRDPHVPGKGRRRRSTQLPSLRNPPSKNHRLHQRTIFGLGDLVSTEFHVGGNLLYHEGHHQRSTGSRHDSQSVSQLFIRFASPLAQYMMPPQ